MKFDKTQLLAKFKKILYMEFRATLNFRKNEVALNPMYRMFLNFAKSCILSCLSKFDIKEKFHRAVPFLKYKRLKCLWNEKNFVLIWKAFQNTEEWRFSFWNMFFRFRDIDIFLLCSDDVIRFATKKWKILNKRYLWKYWSSVLETWHHKCALDFSPRALA